MLKIEFQMVTECIAELRWNQNLIGNDEQEVLRRCKKHAIKEKRSNNPWQGMQLVVDSAQIFWLDTYCQPSNVELIRRKTASIVAKIAETHKAIVELSAQRLAEDVAVEMAEEVKPQLLLMPAKEDEPVVEKKTRRGRKKAA